MGRLPALRGPLQVLCAASLLGAGCDGTLDAGHNVQEGPLPVDERNPILIVNDSCTDNWAVELALLRANHGGPRVAGIVIDATSYWPDGAANLGECGKLLAAASASGLVKVPAITPGATAPLAVPTDQVIQSTTAPRSAGGRLIVDLSRQLYLPGQSLVVAVGTQLTDLADAYLIDPTVVDRVTVVASLGTYEAPNGIMMGANGDLDPWADWIVAQRFHYVQVSVVYGQLGEVASGDLPNLPRNPLGDWMAGKVSGGKLSGYINAADQLAVLAAGLPSFTTTAIRCSPNTSSGFSGLLPGQGPPLQPSATGNVTLVTAVAQDELRNQLWQALRDPATFDGS